MRVTFWGMLRAILQTEIKVKRLDNTAEKTLSPLFHGNREKEASSTALKQEKQYFLDSSGG